MLIQSLAIASVVLFSAVVLYGHALLLKAIWSGKQEAETVKSARRFAYIPE